MVFINPNVNEKSQFFAGVAFSGIIALYFLVNAFLMCKQLFHTFRMMFKYIQKRRNMTPLQKTYNKVSNMSSRFSSRNVTPDISAINYLQTPEKPHEKFEKQSARFYSTQTLAEDTHRNMMSHRKISENESIGFGDKVESYSRNYQKNSPSNNNLMKIEDLENEDLGFDDKSTWQNTMKNKEEQNNVTVWDVRVNNYQPESQGQNSTSITKRSIVPIIPTRHNKVKLERHPEFT